MPSAQPDQRHSVRHNQIGVVQNLPEIAVLPRFGYTVHARNRDITAGFAASDPRPQLGDRIGHLNGVHAHTENLKIRQHELTRSAHHRLRSGLLWLAGRSTSEGSSSPRECRELHSRGEPRVPSSPSSDGWFQAHFTFSARSTASPVLKCSPVRLSVIISCIAPSLEPTTGVPQQGFPPSPWESPRTTGWARREILLASSRSGFRSRSTFPGKSPDVDCFSLLPPPGWSVEVRRRRSPGESNCRAGPTRPAEWTIPSQVTVCRQKARSHPEQLRSPGSGSTKFGLT